MKNITIKTKKQLIEFWSSFENNARVEVILDGQGFVLDRNADDVIYTACDNSTVTAYGSSTVTACNNSTVTACGSSTVRACNNSTVRAYDNSTVTELLHSSILINCTGRDILPIKHHSSAQIINQAPFRHSKESFLDIYPPDDNGFVTLYKVTNQNGRDYKTDSIQYVGTVECPDWDNDHNRQCGGGLHLSPLPELALEYNSGPIKKCKVHIDDFVVYPHDISKVRCRVVHVLDDDTSEEARHA